MKQPEGFIMPGNEHKVCKLIKPLYELKQAPKQWHQKFDEVILSSGFNLNQFDKCAYNRFDSSGSRGEQKPNRKPKKNRETEKLKPKKLKPMRKLNNRTKNRKQKN